MTDISNSASVDDVDRANRPPHQRTEIPIGNAAVRTGSTATLESVPGPRLPGVLASPDQRIPLRRRLHRYFEASCDARPSAPALEVDGLRLTYEDLDARANRLAHFLSQNGVAPRSRVAILLNRSVHTYVTLLAILKAGATFVPIDPASPQDRVEYITEDSSVELVVATSDLAPLASTSSCPVVCLDSMDDGALAQMPASRPDLELDEDPVAYIIYTSGSSGRPKGVAVAQSSICNFISIVPRIYRVGPHDRVYQGMTIAFDFSIEEIWPTWAMGAAIVAGPTDGRRLGSDLALFLQENAVTVLYCVPTVLATIDRDLPLVHTLNVGGEACPQELVERWATDDRVILNTYGPTETTVTAVMSELLPGQPVTIGYALPSYQAYLLDDNLRPVHDGETGEICIGGPGVAVEYVGRPDLTAEKFVPNPFTGEGRLYRTGDLGRWTACGIEYLGRADSEVKVRGHRIDLQEIENQLREDPEVQDAVATVSKATNELAAYITRLPGEPDDVLIERLHDRLVATLPPYMVPAYMSVLDKFPMLPSGKVDRKSLPAPRGNRLVKRNRPYVPPSTPLERSLCEAWGEALQLASSQISLHDDFFVDLGGHSLAAATVVSLLRRREVGRQLAIGDLYANPTVAELVQHIETARSSPRRYPRYAPRVRRYGGFRVAMAGVTQLAMLYAVMLVFCIPVAVIYSWHNGIPSRQVMLQMMAFLPVTYLLGRWVLPVVVSRVLSFGLREGTYPLWGLTHLRVWAIQRALAWSPCTVLSGSPLLVPYLRLLGARVGKDCHVATGEVGLPCFLDIRDDVSIGYGVSLQSSLVEAGRLTLGRVLVRDGAFVGASSVVVAGSKVGDDAALAEHSVLGPDQTLPAGERWAGSPAAPAGGADATFARLSSAKAGPRRWSPLLMAGFCIGALVLEVLPLVAILPAVLMVWWALLTIGLLMGLLVTVFTGPLYVLTVCMLIANLRVVFVRSIRAGVWPLRSRLGLQKWFGDKLLESSLMLTNTLYATLYTVPWLRLLGARIGPGCEVSTVAHIDAELLELQPQSFVADMARVGSAAYHNGLFALDKTDIGERAFVGNASFIPSGTSLGSGSLIGVHSVPPPDGVPPDTSWLGSPAIYLPRRQESQAFDEDLTFRPSRGKVRRRLAIEFLRITLPSSILSVAVYVALWAVSLVAEEASTEVVVAFTPLAFLVMGLATVLLVALLKWLLVGAYKPRVEPLWSGFVRRSELVTGLYEAAAVPGLLQGLVGTPLLGPLLRLFGTKVGRRAMIETTFFTEFDLVKIGDDTAINGGVSLQTHLFEDRVMKMSTLTIERGSSVGTRSIVLYDAVVSRGSVLGPLSLVMKGESLTPSTRWTGIPAQFQG